MGLREWLLAALGSKEQYWHDQFDATSKNIAEKDATISELSVKISELEGGTFEDNSVKPSWLDSTQVPYNPIIECEGTNVILDPRDIYMESTTLRTIAVKWRTLSHNQKLWEIWKYVINALTYQYDKSDNWQPPIVTIVKKHGDCLMPDTPIIVNRNGNSDIIEVSELKEGDWIFTGSHRGNGNASFSRVNWVRKKKTDKNIYRLRTARSVIDVTEDHLIQVKDSNKRVFTESKNVIGKRICMPKSISNSFRNSALDYEIGWVYGLFAAEGYCGRSIWRIYNTDREVLEKAKDIMNGRRFNSVRSLKFEIRRYDSFKEGTKTNFGERKKELYVLVAKSKTVGSLKKFCEWQRKMFYTESKHKRVPYSILNGSLESKRGFVDGHWMGDKWCSTSKILMFGMSVLFERLGIKTAIHDSTKNFCIEMRTMTSNKRSVKFLGKTDGYVYDLNVDDPHLFCAGDVIVHNCEDGTCLFVTLCRIAHVPADSVFNATGWYRDGTNAYGHSYPIVKMEDGNWYIMETTIDFVPNAPKLFKGSNYDASWGYANWKITGKGPQQV